MTTVMSHAVDREQEIIALKERNRELLEALKYARTMMTLHSNGPFIDAVIAKSQS